MEGFALYLLKSVVWLSGFALIYILFLRNERFFFLNRIYLIAGILISFIIPLIAINYTVIIPVADLQYQSSIGDIRESGSTIVLNLKLALSILYLFGVLFVLHIVIRQARAVFRVIKRSEVISIRPVKLIRTHDYTSAFSFFSYVFVNPSVTDIETKEILIHELVHIRQKHWFDLLLSELLCIIQWFNPVAWIYVRLIRQNHEYLADEAALQQTSDPAVYKAVLLNQIVGAPVVSLTNSFNYSLNKKRFNMMKNIINSPYRKMKILLILPVAALLLYSFAKPEYRYVKESPNKTMLQDTVKNQNANVNALPPAPEAPPPPPADLIKNPEAPAPPPPADSIKNQKAPTPPQAPLYVVDGVAVTAAVAGKIDANTIESMNVLKGKTASKKYGRKGKNGVVEITSKKSVANPVETVPANTTIIRPVEQVPAKNTLDEVKVVGYGQPAQPAEVKIRTADGKQPLIIVDGVVSEKGLSGIDPNAVESVTVLKDESAVAKYGEKGRNGVVSVILKK